MKRSIDVGRLTKQIAMLGELRNGVSNPFNRMNNGGEAMELAADLERMLSDIEKKLLRNRRITLTIREEKLCS